MTLCLGEDTPGQEFSFSYLPDVPAGQPQLSRALLDSRLILHNLQEEQEHQEHQEEPLLQQAVIQEAMKVEDAVRRLEEEVEVDETTAEMVEVLSLIHI